MRAGGIQEAWRRRRRNQRAHEGWGPTLARVLGAVLAVGLLVPLVQRIFLAWLDGPPGLYADAVQALLLRSGIVVVGWTAIDVYDALIRGGDRDVLAIWPVDPAAVARFELGRLAWSRFALVLGAAALLAPIALVDPGLWGLMVAHTAVVWALALGASAVGVLLAVEVSTLPAARPWLDLVRGNNHPAQAAFLYAPGVVLLACGALIQAAAIGVTRAHAGDAVGFVLLLTPLPPAAICASFVPSLARRTWFRAGGVMAEVDARYALIEDRQEALRVYLDWAIRFLPDRIARYALLDLRHGWRARRTWITGAWLVGLASLVAAWTRDPSGPGRAAAIAVIGTWLVASVGVRIARDEPEFLAVWLPSGGAAKWIGRAVALGLWVQPAIALGAVAAGFRQGWAAFGLVLAAGEGTAALAVGAALVCGHRGGLTLYGPVAALGAALVVRGVWG